MISFEVMDWKRQNRETADEFFNDIFSFGFNNFIFQGTKKKIIEIIMNAKLGQVN